MDSELTITQGNKPDGSQDNATTCFCDALSAAGIPTAKRAHMTAHIPFIFVRDIFQGKKVVNDLFFDVTLWGKTSEKNHIEFWGRRSPSSNRQQRRKQVARFLAEPKPITFQISLTELLCEDFDGFCFFAKDQLTMPASKAYKLSLDELMAIRPSITFQEDWKRDVDPEFWKVGVVHPKISKNSKDFSLLRELSLPAINTFRLEAPEGPLDTKAKIQKAIDSTKIVNSDKSIAINLLTSGWSLEQRTYFVLIENKLVKEVLFQEVLRIRCLQFGNSLFTFFPSLVPISPPEDLPDKCLAYQTPIENRSGIFAAVFDLHGNPAGQTEVFEELGKIKGVSKNEINSHYSKLQKVLKKFSNDPFVQAYIVWLEGIRILLGKLGKNGSILAKDIHNGLVGALKKRRWRAMIGIQKSALQEVKKLVGTQFQYSEFIPTWESLNRSKEAFSASFKKWQESSSSFNGPLQKVKGQILEKKQTFTTKVQSSLRCWYAVQVLECNLAFKKKPLPRSPPKRKTRQAILKYISDLETEDPQPPFWGLLLFPLLNPLRKVWNKVCEVLR
jgi:hypothetical protein